MSHFVYRVYGIEDRLLYVGCTNSPVTRLHGHSKRSPWFETVTRVTLDRYDDRADALLAEKVAIRLEFPRHNIKDRAPDHPEGARVEPYHGTWLAYPEDCPVWAARWRERRAHWTARAAA